MNLIFIYFFFETNLVQMETSSLGSRNNVYFSFSSIFLISRHIFLYLFWGTNQILAINHKLLLHISFEMNFQSIVNNEISMMWRFDWFTTFTIRNYTHHRFKNGKIILRINIIYYCIRHDNTDFLECLNEKKVFFFFRFIQLYSEFDCEAVYIKTLCLFIDYRIKTYTWEFMW